jgi:hypothetical protein
VRDRLGSAARLVVCGVYGVGRDNLKREREKDKGRDGPDTRVEGIAGQRAGLVHMARPKEMKWVLCWAVRYETKPGHSTVAFKNEMFIFL